MAAFDSPHWERFGAVERARALFGLGPKRQHSEPDSPFEKLLAIHRIHRPQPVEVEVFFENDDGTINTAHAPFDAECTSQDECAGHIIEIKSCVECGDAEDFNGGVVHRQWPCRTARVLGVTE